MSVVSNIVLLMHMELIVITYTAWISIIQRPNWSGFTHYICKKNL